MRGCASCACREHMAPALLGPAPAGALALASRRNLQRLQPDFIGVEKTLNPADFAVSGAAGWASKQQAPRVEGGAQVLDWKVP